MNREQIIAMARELQWMEMGADLWGASLEGAMSIYALERFAHLVAAAERERCIEIIETYKIPVGNSAAGEMACEWTYEALEKIRDEIRALGETK